MLEAGHATFADDAPVLVPISRSRAIVRAVTLGLTDVARALARCLEEHRRGPNLIDLGTRRGRP
jgi:hypothetical protein